MGPTAAKRRSAGGVLARGLAAALLALVPRAAGADDDGFRERDDMGWILLQMQREAITAQEEQAREAGRIRRRSELQQDRERHAVESQAYFESVLEASRAALLAPQGVYYRKPGFASAEPPANAQTVKAGGISYLHDRGIFWRLPGPPYVVVVPPYGAAVEALPAGSAAIVDRTPPLYYFFGVFYEEKDGRFEVVKPPAGTLVGYLPDGYQLEKVRGSSFFTFGPTYFRPVFVQGVLVYEVVEP